MAEPLRNDLVEVTAARRREEQLTLTVRSELVER